MNQINVNIIPPMQIGIIKKAAKISWASDMAARSENAEIKNVKFDIESKKKK